MAASSHRVHWRWRPRTCELRLTSSCSARICAQYSATPASPGPSSPRDIFVCNCASATRARSRHQGRRARAVGVVEWHKTARALPMRHALALGGRGRGVTGHRAVRAHDFAEVAAQRILSGLPPRDGGDQGVVPAGGHPPPGKFNRREPAGSGARSSDEDESRARGALPHGIAALRNDGERHSHEGAAGRRRRTLSSHVALARRWARVAAAQRRRQNVSGLLASATCPAGVTGRAARTRH